MAISDLIPSVVKPSSWKTWVDAISSSTDSNDTHRGSTANPHSVTAGQAGAAADPHDLAGTAHSADTLANLNAKVSDATLDDAGDSRDPNAHALGGAAHSADTLANLNAKVSDATLDDSGDSRTPSTHASTHQDAGADEINLAGLAGKPADLATHEADTSPHSATVEATASRLVLRDAAGRFQAADPDAAQDVATKAHVDTVASAVTGKAVQQARPVVPLDIPTHDDEGGGTHPDVVYFPEGWNGWRYWMAFTPYPDWQRESTNIVASNDGVNWQVPDGLTNPVFSVSDAVALGHERTSDPCLAYDPDGDELWLYVRASLGSVPEKNYRLTSSDGVSWSTAAETLSGSATSLLSPTVVHDGGQWVIFHVDISGSDPIITKRTSADGFSWGTPTTVSIPLSDPWHITAAHVNGRFHLLVNNDPGASKGDRLYYFDSSDGETFAAGVDSPAVPLVANGFDDRTDDHHYRSAWVAKTGPNGLMWDVWVAGRTSDVTILGVQKGWNIGFLADVDFSVADQGKLSVVAGDLGTRVVAYDSFDRPGGNLGKADKGGNWSTWGESWEISAGRARVVANNIGYAVLDLGTEVQAEVSGVNRNSTRQWGLVLCGVDIDNMIEIRVYGSTPTPVRIATKVGGVLTNVATGGLDFGQTRWDRLRAYVVDTGTELQVVAQTEVGWQSIQASITGSDYEALKVGSLVGITAASVSNPMDNFVARLAK